jgi:cysteine synthase A
MSVKQSIVDTVFETPLVDISALVPARERRARVLLKLEFFNPLSSVKDRIGRAMIEAGEAEGLLTPDTHIIEPTSGNTGIALAFIAAARGYRLTLTMPETMSIERRHMLRALGASLELTPSHKGMGGAIERARELARYTPNAWTPGQFSNPANPAVHERTTGPEIWKASEGTADIVVAGVGTGGTITGTTRYLRRQKPGVQAVAVEPKESPVLSGGKPGPHRIQGIGAGFIPDTLDASLLNAVETVTSDDAAGWSRILASSQGILGGISTGANVCVAVRLAQRPENEGKTIVTFACSAGERYLSTPLYSDAYEHTDVKSLLQQAYEIGAGL